MHGFIDSNNSFIGNLCNYFSTYGVHKLVEGFTSQGKVLYSNRYLPGAFVDSQQIDREYEFKAQSEEPNRKQKKKKRNKKKNKNVKVQKENHQIFQETPTHLLSENQKHIKGILKGILHQLIHRFTEN